MPTVGLTRRNVSRRIRPETLAKPEYAYGPARILNAAGEVVRVISQAELANRNLPDPRDDGDAVIPAHVARKPKRHRGKQVPRYNVPKGGEWINYEAVQPEPRWS